MIRLLVLLTWHPATGLPVHPVGVLGIDTSWLDAARVLLAEVIPFLGEAG